MGGRGLRGSRGEEGGGALRLSGPPSLLPLLDSDRFGVFLNVFDVSVARRPWPASESKGDIGSRPRARRRRAGCYSVTFREPTKGLL